MIDDLLLFISCPQLAASRLVVAIIGLHIALVYGRFAKALLHDGKPHRYKLFWLVAGVAGAWLVICLDHIFRLSYQILVQGGCTEFSRVLGQESLVDIIWVAKVALFAFGVMHIHAYNVCTMNGGSTKKTFCWVAFYLVLWTASTWYFLIPRSMQFF
jgi:hypothetical protein